MANLTHDSFLEDHPNRRGLTLDGRSLTLVDAFDWRVRSPRRPTRLLDRLASRPQRRLRITERERMVRSWWRLGGMLGIAFVATWLLKMVGTGVTPPYDDPIGEIREYWQDDGRRYLVVQYASLLTMVIFLLPYMVALTTMLGRAETGARMWSRVSLAGGVSFVAVTIAANSIWTSLAMGADAISDDGMRTLMYLDAAVFYIGVFPFAVFVTAGSLVILTTGVMRTWLGYVGLADGIAVFVAPLVVLEEHSGGALGLFYFLALVVGAAWVVATGVVMLRLREEPADSPAGARA